MVFYSPPVRKRDVIRANAAWCDGPLTLRSLYPDTPELDRGRRVVPAVSINARDHRLTAQCLNR